VEFYFSHLACREIQSEKKKEKKKTKPKTQKRKARREENCLKSQWLNYFYFYYNNK
jgi:hypothetical protein